MMKLFLNPICAIVILFGLNGCFGGADIRSDTKHSGADTLTPLPGGSPDLLMTSFTGPDLTPSPACLAVAPTGEVFVGVDMIGSLGKDMGKGFIRKFIDENNDGIMDKHTEFARVDNPRGIFILGDRIFVLHTTFSEETEKATGMDLVVFEDKNRDGIADGPARPLIVGLSNTKYIQERGTDHATNGIRMGIDGWIYISVGDFGFHNARGADGKELTMLGGGILRVRPDGTEMEIYTHGLRNIYDVAIDPYMNIFTRDNTNDGGGWDIRFSHQIQSGEYGYPLLFQNFTEEIIPALAMLGGGSGTGALYMDEDTWPDKYNKVPMMADWGRSYLYLHRVTPDGASFTQTEEEFINLPQITDLDVDGSGRLYLSAWDGAGYSGNPDKGYVARVVPEGWTYKTFPNVEKASIKELSKMLQSGSAVARFYASQELLVRPSKKAAKAALKITVDKKLPLDVRVAGLYTYAQIAGEDAIPALVRLTNEDAMQEFALRALADRKPYVKEVPVLPFLNALKSSSERVVAAATIGLGRLGRTEIAPLIILQTRVPSSFVAPEKGTEGPHAIPNSEIIPAHLAVRALVNLNAVDACVAFLETEYNELALWALRYMHTAKAVDGLIAAYRDTEDQELKEKILTTLSRLYTEEAPYDASWWWGTRPDSHGPYYKGVVWESSPVIEKFLITESEKAGGTNKQFFVDLDAKNRMGISVFSTGNEGAVAQEKVPQIDLKKITNQKGQVGKTSSEDVLLAVAKIKGDPAKGKAIFAQQGCYACHSISKSEPMKGPFMGQVGAIMNREQIAEPILKPNASIAQGFATVMITTKDRKSYMGFVTQETAEKVVMRNMAGEVSTVNKKDIASRKELGTSMMPTGLANSLSIEEFASLLSYLEKQK